MLPSRELSRPRRQPGHPRHIAQTGGKGAAGHEQTPPKARPLQQHPGLWHPAPPPGSSQGRQSWLRPSRDPYSGAAGLSPSSCHPPRSLPTPRSADPRLTSHPSRWRPGRPLPSPRRAQRPQPQQRAFCCWLRSRTPHDCQAQRRATLPGTGQHRSGCTSRTRGVTPAAAQPHMATASWWPRARPGRRQQSMTQTGTSERDPWDGCWGSHGRQGLSSATGQHKELRLAPCLRAVGYETAEPAGEGPPSCCACCRPLPEPAANAGSVTGTGWRVPFADKGSLDPLSKQLRRCALERARVARGPVDH